MYSHSKGVGHISENDIFQQIARRFNIMSNAERKISNYLLQHKTDIQSMTIQELASACGVGTASLTRYARSFGCRNFNAFRTRLCLEILHDLTPSADVETGIDLYSEVKAGDSIDVKCRKLCHICTEALNQTQAQIHASAIAAAVDILYRASSVYCFGQGNSSAVAMDAATRFATITNKFHWIFDSHLQADTASLLREHEVVLYFSFSGSTRELIENARLIRNTPGKLILVTRFPNSLGAQLADIVIICGANESPSNQGSVAAKVGQLLIIDLLYNEYCSRDVETVLLHKKRTLDATEEKMV